jgi:Major Facilitator Superfamily
MRCVTRVLIPKSGPLRVLAVISFANAAGTSLLVTSLVLYFTKVVSLSGGQVAAGLTLGGGLGLLVGVPLGHLGDRYGARELMMVLHVLLALAIVGYVFAEDFASFLVVSCFVGVLDRGAAAVDTGVVARALPDDGRQVRDRAYLRAVTNVGFAGGSALAAIGIALDSAAGYHGLFILDALSYAFVVGLSFRLPRLPRLPAEPTGPRLVVLRDRPYLAIIGLTALLAIHNSMLDVGLPLWVAGHTQAPAAIVGIIFVINCVAVALFSVRLASGSETPAAASRAALRSGVSLLAACTLMAISGAGGAVTAVTLLVLAMLLQAVGEMQQAASQWGLSLGLARVDRQGQYQGAASTGLALALSVGPLVMAGVVSLGSAGWLILGLGLLATGAATVPATRWALATRTAQ